MSKGIESRPVMRETGKLQSVPTHQQKHIVAFKLSNSSIAYLDHGVYIEFDHQSLELLKRYPASDFLRITSQSASPSYSHLDCDKIWTTVLRNAKHVNLHGIWATSLLQNFVGLMPNLRILSLTYGGCHQLSEVIRCIKSKNLSELHLHVGVGQNESVLAAIGNLAEQGIKLKKLFLVFSESFIMEFKELFPILQKDAQVVLLHGGDIKDNIKTIQKYGYKRDGNIQMARNKADYDDVHPKKIYEIYKVFIKNFGNRRFRQGCLLGEFEKEKPIQELVDMVNLKKEEPIQEPVDTTTCKPNFDLMCVTKTPPYAVPHPDFIQSEVIERKCNLSKYGSFFYRVGCDSGLEYNDDLPEQSLDGWRLPGFSTTTIQKVIYHEGLTEYLTSNGFYFRLEEMNDEKNFYKYIRASHRLIFECVYHLRFPIITKNMQTFLKDTVHIEFVGDWLIRGLKAVGYRLCCPNLRKLTMVRICIRDGPLRLLVENVFSECVKKALTHLHVDARDAFDQSIGSVFNGIRESLNGLEELVIIANEWPPYFGENEQNKFPCQLRVLISDMIFGVSYDMVKGASKKVVKKIRKPVLAPGGTCTVVVMEPCYLSDLLRNGFNEDTIDALVLPPFKRQSPSKPPAPPREADEQIVMKVFYSLQNDRHFYVVVPWEPPILSFTSTLHRNQQDQIPPPCSKN